MLKSLDNLIKHMQEEHPDAEFFGDSCFFDVNRKVISQKCFLCGKELLNNEEEIIALRSLISEWIDRFNDVSFEVQNTVLAGNGWTHGERGGLWGWTDPNTNVHYLAKEAIVLQKLRGRKRDTEPLPYN